jgi:signal transduction histidine kinase/DNA-binding response OmpR family regulator/HPt (histidine-containing phosphotransfer) domain-containing protein
LALRFNRQSLRDAIESLSLAEQIRLVVIVSVVVSILAVQAITVLFDISRARHRAIDFARSLPAALQGDFSTGEHARLTAVLASHPGIEAIVVVSPDGDVASRYVRPGGDYAAGEEFGRQPPMASPGWLSRIGAALALAPTIVPVPVSPNVETSATAVVTFDQWRFWRAAGGGLAVFPIAIVLGLLVARRAANSLKRKVVDPLAQLASATRGGNWANGTEAPPAAPRRNELNELASNFDLLAVRLTEYERDLQNVRRASASKIVEHTKAMEQRIKSAETVMRSKDDFFANVSHEIRTPMNGLLGMAELLAGTKLDKRQQRFVDSMRTAAATMMQIINDTLDDSKIEAGKMELVCEPFDLRGIMEDVGQLYAGAAEGKKLELICRIDSGVPTNVVGDALRLKQVLSNLVSNAVKYTEEGEIQMRVATDQEVQDGKCRLHFSVADTGPGIPEGQRGAVFEAFTQLENATRVGGTGLGLSIATRLVKLMGGERIDLRSEVGHGSTFSFALPFAVGSAAVADAAQVDFRGLRVLLVDDNSSSYLQLEETLMDWSVEVTVVNRARVMLERLRSAAQRGSRFDLVLIDHSLPDLTSAEILRAIRAEPLTRSTYVVLMTALAFDPDDDADAAIEPDACVPKPVRRDLLERALRASRDPGATESTAHADSRHGRPGPIVLGLDVLVADDNAINREVAIAMLEERRCRVTVAEDGRAAVNLARSNRFDVILMDCQMPVIDGYQATMVIRREEGLRGAAPTPIIALTANVRAKDRDQCLAAGMTSFLSKPFTQAQLVEILRPIAEARGTLETPPVVDEAAESPSQSIKPRPDRHAEPSMLTEPAVVDMLEGSLFEPARGRSSRSSVLPKPSAPEIPVLDHEQVEAVLSLGRPSVFAELCRMLEESAPAALQTIEKALAAGDLATVGSTAHALKSPCANLGGRQLAAQLERCELAACEARDARQVQKEAEGLQQNYAALVSALAQVTARGTGTE